MVKKLIQPENVVYIILLAVAVFFGVRSDGWIPILRSAGLVIFLGVVVTNTFELYKAFIVYLRVKEWEVSKGRGRYLIGSYALAVTLYFVALTDYYQKFVLLFIAILFSVLFAFDKAKAFLGNHFYVKHSPSGCRSSTTILRPHVQLIGRLNPQPNQT